MRIHSVALLVVVGVAAIACTPSQENEALRDAQQVCIDLGYGNGGSGDSSSDEGDITSTEWSELALDLNGIADQAARAARSDQRWNRLSNSVTDALLWAEQMSIATGPYTSDSERNSAQVQADAIDYLQTARVLKQECRKAQAQ